jgi:hypothetical protein
MSKSLYLLMSQFFHLYPLLDDMIKMSELWKGVLKA